MKLLFVALVVYFFITCCHALAIINFQVVQVNSVFFNGTGTTTQETSLHATYFPISGQPGKNATYKSLPTLFGKSHTLFFSRLYANTTYSYHIYQIFSTIPLLNGTFTTGTLPSQISGVLVTLSGAQRPTNELILTNFPDFFGNGNNFIYKYDDTGKIVWYLQDTTPYASGFGMSEDISNNLYIDAVSELKVYTPWGTLVNSVQTDGCPDFHHEVALELGQQFAWSLNIEIVNFNGAPQQGDTFVKWNTWANTVQIVKKTSDFISTSTRTIDSNSTAFGYIPCKNTSILSIGDWTHGNSLRRSYPLGKYLVYSSRNLYMVYIFDYQTLNLLYIVGGQSSTFTFPNPNDMFSVQHCANVYEDYDNQNIQLLVFDNGIYDTPTPVNRGLLLNLDLVGMKATKIWDYKLNPSLNPNCLGQFTGSAFKLLNGDHLINFPTCSPPPPSVSDPGTAYVAHLDENGNEKWVYSQSMNNIYFSYRAYQSFTIAGEQLISIN
jgi:hypothetical protein